MLMTTNNAYQIPYARFKDAQLQLVNIVAIDYFFAKEMLSCALQDSDQVDVELIFHLFIALSESLRQGHSCLPLSEVANNRFGFQCDSDNMVTHHGYTFPDIDNIKTLLAVLTLSVKAQKPVVLSDNRLFIRRYFQFEQEVIAFIDNRCSAANLVENINSTEQIAAVSRCLNALFPPQIESSEGESLVEIDWQKLAVANALNKSFTIIAGGPGTGKTYTVTKLLAALIMQSNKVSLNIALAAPTGKAAQRLAESIGSAVNGFSELVAEEVLAAIPKEAQTIHRLLGVIPNSPNFRHHQENKLNIDVLLIDEFSMVDLPLMTRVVRALPEHCQVILLGDADQLPSVAAGSVLADLAPYNQTKYSKENTRYLQTVCGEKSLAKGLKSHADHVTFLTKSRRFDGQGEIGQLAKAVIAGDNAGSWQLLQSSANKDDSQLTWLNDKSAFAKCENQQRFDNSNTQNSQGTIDFNWLMQLVEQYYQPIKYCTNLTEAFANFSQFRILAATRNGATGVEHLNQLIEAKINPTSYINKSTTGSSTELYHGKPIMINQNDYRLGLYNGDIGFIWRNEAGHLMAVFQQNEQFLWLLPSRLPSYETVYAMTIHKTQGSEFDHVAMVLPADTNSQILSRELLYTGITRAKTQLTIQANRAVWFQGVESEVKRHSGISIQN